MQKNIYLLTVFVLLFAIEISEVVNVKWHRSRCFRFLPSSISSCARKCPKIFRRGLCERYGSTSQCICRSLNAGHSIPYTVEEAKCIQLAAKGDPNPQCATNLCPPGFQAAGQIIDVNGQWKWYCNAYEFGKYQGNQYTLDRAKRIYNVCNDVTISERTERCRNLCPLGHRHGQCVSDGDGSTPQCSCTQFYRLNDQYGIQEANDMASVCNKEVKNNDGCAKLCPECFNQGICFNLVDSYMCGCRQNEDVGQQVIGWYTISEVRAMVRVCSSEVHYNEGCKRLCPFGYKRDGGCSEYEGRFECVCMKDGEGQEEEFITLKEAFFKSDLSQNRFRNS